MKVKLSELPELSCFTTKNGKGKKFKKAVDGRVISKGKGGKARIRTPKGDPEVEQAACPLDMIGLGMRKHPDEVVEIGNGRPRVRGVRSLRAP